jgi:CheY-like chemotaxis protein
VASAAEALERVRASEAFDLAVLDMHLPESDGLELARKLHQIAPGLRLVMLSSIGGLPTDIEPGLFVAALTKPVKPSQLFDAIAKGFGFEPALAVGEIAPVSAPLGVAPLRLLLAEDNPVNQKVALHMLAKLGYRADTAANGREVLEAVERQPYDVIFMDVQMPEMDGLEATRRVRASQAAHAHRPWIIALTANAIEGDREETLRAGMDDYLSKPIKTAELAAALSRVGSA